MDVKSTLWLALIGLALISSDSFALLRFGLKAGVNLANVEAKDTDVDYEIKPGFTAGAMAEIPISPGGGMAVRGELLYVQKGAKQTLMNNEGKLLAEELALAPFLVFYFPGVKVQPFLEAGPEFGWNTLAKSKQDGETWNVGADWRDNNFSINLGAGVLIPFEHTDLVIDARYNLGLVDVSTGVGNSTVKTNGIQIFVGYNFFKL